MQQPLSNQERCLLRALVDECYQEFYEDRTGVPSTDWADNIIDRAVEKYRSGGARG